MDFSTSSELEHELKAKRYAERGEIDLALAEYQSTELISWRALKNMGRLYAERKADYNKAMECFTKSLEIQEKVN